MKTKRKIPRFGHHHLCEVPDELWKMAESGQIKTRDNLLQCVGLVSWLVTVTISQRVHNKKPRKIRPGSNEGCRGGMVTFRTKGKAYLTGSGDEKTR